MALPSLFKRGCDEACGWGWVGEPFSFLSALCFSSFCLNLIGVLRSRHPWNRNYTSKSRTRFHAFRLNCCLDWWINSLFAPPWGQNLCLVFIVSNRGILGIRTVHRFLGLIGSIEAALLVWSEFAKGFLYGSPWENRLTFNLWHPGHNSCLLKSLL